MTELIQTLKELEQSFSDNKNKSAMIFFEAKKLIIDSSKIKINESEIEILI